MGDKEKVVTSQTSGATKPTRSAVVRKGGGVMTTATHKDRTIKKSTKKT